MRLNQLLEARFVNERFPLSDQTHGFAIVIDAKDTISFVRETGSEGRAQFSQTHDGDCAHGNLTVLHQSSPLLLCDYSVGKAGRDVGTNRWSSAHGPPISGTLKGGGLLLNDVAGVSHRGPLLP